MYKCIFCGLNNSSATARFCAECGPEGPATNWVANEVDQLTKVTQYAALISEYYFESHSDAEVEKFSMRIRERLKISHAKHVEVLSHLYQQKKAVVHLSNFRFEFNENVNDAYAGHDTFLDFRYTNLSEDELFKVSLHWDDPETIDRIDFRAETKTFIQPFTPSKLGGKLVFERSGIKEISDLIITITDQFGESARFRAEPFRFKVGSLEQRITQNISTHNQISIEGRGVIDASGLGTSNIKTERDHSTEPSWIPLSFTLVRTDSTIDNRIQNDFKGLVGSDETEKLIFDEIIINLLANAFEQVGMEGVVKVAKSNSMNCELQIIENMQIDIGFSSTHFVNHKDSGSIIFENPFILFTEEKITSSIDLSKYADVFEEVKATGRPLLILAEEVGGVALEVLESKVQRNIVKVAAINVPISDDRWRKVVKDISILTGGIIIRYPYQGVHLESLGQTRRIEITGNSTEFIDGAGSYSVIVDRVELIRTEIESAKNQSDIEFHQERIAKLAGGVAIIKIYTDTDGEFNAKRLVIDNCVGLTRAKIRSGGISSIEELKEFIGSTLV